MTAYMVYIRDRMKDPAEFKKYEEISQKANPQGARKPLAYYGKIETLEGPTIDGATIIPFDSIEAAKKAYNDPTYQKAIPYRLKGADYRVFIVEGV